MLPLLKKSGLKIAMEMIDFQSDTFGQDIEVLMTKIQSKALSGEYKTHNQLNKSPELEMLTSLIFNRLGLKVEFIVNSAMAAILPFYSNKNHVFLNDMFRGGFSIREQEKILRKAQDKAGFVNSHKAKVGGIFSEYENLVYMNFYDMFKVYKMSPGEMTAILLHELGHGFYACEYADRLESNNQALANVAQELASKKDSKDMIYIFRELEKVNSKITEEEVDKLINGNRVIAGATWFKVIVGGVRNQMDNSKYDDSSFEQMADNFAGRFKYGRQLMTGLEKLHALLGNVNKHPKWMAVLSMLQLARFVALAAFTMVMLFGGLIPHALLYGVLTFLTLRTAGEDFKDYTYDELKIRYKRVRNEYVELLKDLKIPKQQLDDTLADIYLMDSMINETHRYNNLLAPLANFIFSDAKAANKSIIEQQMLESLTFSDLFVKSAELRSIA